MSTTTTGRAPKLSALGILAAERIKLLSLRSTWWSLGIALVLTIGFPLLLAAASSRTITDENGHTVALDLSEQRSQLVGTSTIGVSIAVLVIAIMAVLTIGGEYSTGLIRSSYTTIPKRWPMLAAKALVVAVLSAVVGVVGVFSAAALVIPMLSGSGVTVGFGDQRVLFALVGASAYLVIIALIALGIGVLVRSTVAGIGIIVGLIFVAPFVLQLMQGLAKLDWAPYVQAFLPSALGGRLFAIDDPTQAATLAQNGIPTGPTPFEWWQALLLLAAWLGAVWIPAGITTMRRDV